jgi:chemotaxis protein MotB
MKKISILLLLVLIASCVSQKEFTALQEKHEQAENELVNVKANLQKCLVEKEKEDAQAFALTEQVKYLQEDKKKML